MRIKGKEITGPNIEIIPIIRQDGPIYFKAKAVVDYEPFYKLCPAPKPPMMIKRGAGKVPDLENKNYKLQMEQYNALHTHWIIVTSLRETEGLEWDTVDYNKSETWENYKVEFKNAGFTELEIGRIIQGVMSANGLDESKLEEARQRFLAGQVEQQEQSSSHSIELKNMQSGELANVS